MRIFTATARAVSAATLIALSIATPAAHAAAPAAPPSRVTIVHGLRGLVADIWLDGKKVLPSFQPERATDPIAIPAGKHRVEIREAGAPATDTPLLSQVLAVPANADLTVVAHLNQAGSPALSVYRERPGTVPAGRSRIVVRHTAAAAAIGVQLDRKSLAEVAPGTEATKDVPPGKRAVSVVAAGATAGDPLLAPQELPLSEGTGMVLYLIGSQKNNTLSWLAQPVRAAATAPTRVATGDSGLRAPSGGSQFPLRAVAVVAALALLTVRRRGSVR